jgi:protoheme IX farnesyltransferase
MYLERDVDGLMRRTRTRPLPQGRVAPEMAVAIGAALAAAALPLMIVGGNLLTGVLGAAAFVIYVWVYTPMKRRSPAALYVGAVPGAIPPLMGWTAATGELGAAGLVLFAVLFLWQVPHFVAIALYRSDEYAAAGFQTLPVARGERRSLVHAAVCAGALVVASLLLGPAGAAGWIYLTAAMLLGGAFFGYSLRGFGAAAPRRWARSLFLASLVYLPLLFGALAVDRWLG